MESDLGRRPADQRGPDRAPRRVRSQVCGHPGSGKSATQWPSHGLGNESTTAPRLRRRSSPRARERLEVLEHAQVRFHTRLTQWQRQVAATRQDVDLAEFIAEMRAEILRLGQVNADLRHQLESSPPHSATEIDATGDESHPAAATDSATTPHLSTALESAASPDASFEGLWSSDPDDRRAAMKAAGKLKGPRGLEALVMALPLAHEANERIHLLNQLARMGGLKDDAVLAESLAHIDPMVRAAAIDVTRGSDVVALATEDANPYVRRRALIRYVQVEPSQAQARLTRAVHDADPGVRRTACAALAGRPDASGVQALLTAADDPDAGVRAAAIRALPPDLRRRLSESVIGHPTRRRTALNAIRAERRALVKLETSPHGR